jgi:ferredoxin
MTRRKQSRGKVDVGGLLNRLAAEEQQFLEREFFAPALPGGVVGVRIGGVVCRIRIDPPTFEGWGVFQPVSHTQARLVRKATLSERRGYLDLFPLIRQIVCRRAGNTWFGSAASFGDRRIRMEGLAVVNEVLCEGCGTCAATCLRAAIGVKNKTAQQVHEMIEASLGG